MAAVPRTGPNALEYSFPGLPAGDYFVLVTTDEDADGRSGETGEPLGTAGSSPQQPLRITHPGVIPLDGVVNFPLGWPGQEPPEPGNDSTSGAGELFLDFYAEVTYDGPGDVDHLKVLIPKDGTYRFWTEGRNTALCSNKLDELDAAIELLDASGALIAEDDNESFGAHNCEEIVEDLTAGTYFVKVEASPLEVPEPGFAIIVHADDITP